MKSNETHSVKEIECYVYIALQVALNLEKAENKVELRTSFITIIINTINNHNDYDKNNDRFSELTIEMIVSINTECTWREYG